jgi:hypothetical protein
LIDLDWNKVRIRNGSNKVNYDYVAFGELVGRAYLKGKYLSNSPDSNAFGAFVLTISPRENIIYSYCIGPNDRGERRYAGWVIGKTNEDVEMGKVILAQTTHYFTDNTNTMY